MAEHSEIEWTDATWNPLVGCEHVGPGCDGCYAARQAFGRLKATPAYAGLAVRRTPDELPRFTGEIRLLPERLDEPLHWRRPRRVFVNSMSDLFHPKVPEDFIRRVFDVMVTARQHTFQVLTKRPARMVALTHDRYATGAEVDAGCELGIWPSLWDTASSGVPARNVHLGTSIETGRYGFRADQLRATDAAVRFLSFEPLLGSVADVDLQGIDWVIVGGESGPGARPMHPAWVRDVRDRCADAGVAFFFKQWGEWIPYEFDPQPPFLESQHGGWIDGHHLPALLTDHELVEGWWLPPIELDDETVVYRRVGKKAAGRLLDGRTWDEQPLVRGPEGAATCS